MKKSSLMTPKRRSRPPSRSREDAQIDLEETIQLDGVKFTPVPCGRHGEEQRYRLKLEGDNDQIVGLGAIADQLRYAGGNLRIEAIETVLNTICAVVPEYIAATGNAVRIGNLVTLKPYATGTLAHVNDSPDLKKNHLEIRATVCPSLRYSISKARLVNSVRKAKGIEYVMGGPGSSHDMHNRVDDVNVIMLYGNNIYIPKQKAGDTGTRGRAWLETRDGKALGRCDILNSTDDGAFMKLQLDTRPRRPECRLVIETYGTENAAADPSAPLFTYSRNVRFVGTLGA